MGLWVYGFMGLWVYGFMGLWVGDALGVPVEFLCKSELKANPVKDMMEGGYHLQVKGTWSDDISEKIIQWYNEGYWTPYGIVFDAGFTTITSIQTIQNLSNPIDAGEKSVETLLSFNKQSAQLNPKI